MGLLHYLDLELGRTRGWIADADWRLKWILGPLSVSGLGLVTGGAIGLIATLGTGGAALVALGGAAMFGPSAVGMSRIRDRLLVMQDQETKLAAL